MALARFWNYVLPVPRTFNSGSFAVQELVNLRSSSQNADAISHFKQTHNLSNTQFHHLSDVLSSDLQGARHFAGSRFHDYEQQVDYKLRTANLPRSGTAHDSVQHLRNVYTGYEDALRPTDLQVELLRELKQSFTVHPKQLDVSRWGSAEFNSISASLSEIQSRMVKANPEQETDINHAVENLRSALKADGFTFVVDSLSYINSQLAIGSNQETQLSTQLENTPNSLEETLTQEWQQRRLQKITAANMRPLQVYNNQDENYAQVISAENLPQSNYFMFSGLSGLVGAAWVYAVVSGTGTYSFLLGVPAVYHYFAKGYFTESYNNRMELVKDIYLRKADGKCDVYFYKGGNYSRVMEGVQRQDIEIMVGENPVIKDFDNVPFRVSGDGNVTLTQLKQQGLPASVVPVRIKGQTYFMHMNYYQNESI